MMAQVTLFQAVLSFVLPFLTGWTLLESLWPNGSRFLRNILGVTLAFGTAGAAWMAGLMLSGSSATAFNVSEVVLLVLLTTSGFLSARHRKLAARWPKTPAPQANRIEITAFGIVLLIAGFLTAMTLDVGPHG